MEILAISVLLLFVFPYSAVVYVLLETGGYIDPVYRIYVAMLFLAISYYKKIQMVSGEK